MEVGRALAAIRDGALYREQGFKTFAAYCEHRWDRKRRWAYQLIDASGVVENVRHGAQALQLNERQARELARLKEPEAQVEAWAAAVASAPAGGVMGKAYESVRERTP